MATTNRPTTYTSPDGKRQSVDVVEATHVDDGFLDMVREVTDSWFPDGPIDWERVWERVEGYTFDDGRYVCMGDEMDSPAMRKIKRVIRKERAES